MPRVRFFFDLGSPYAYLAAERLGGLLPEPVEWQPVLLGGLFKLTGRSSWALGDQHRRQAGIAEIERRCSRYGLPAMRWPDPWPSDYLVAMRCDRARFAAGRGRDFTREAFHDAFQRGRDLSVPGHVLDAGVRAGLARPELPGRDRRCGGQARAARGDPDAALRLGVTGVPTIAIDDELFWGDDRVAEAAAHLARMTAA